MNAPAPQLVLCAGRPFGYHPDAAVCPVRVGCLRFERLAVYHDTYPGAVPEGIDVRGGLCADGHDWRVEGSA